MKKNLFDRIPEESSEELFAELLSAGGVRIERIVSFGQCSPPDFWYQQEEGEWILLLEGSATLGFEERPPVELSAGDHLFLPAGLRHRVARTALDRRTVWLAVFVPSDPPGEGGA